MGVGRRGLGRTVWMSRSPTVKGGIDASLDDSGTTVASKIGRHQSESLTSACTRARERVPMVTFDVTRGPGDAGRSATRV